MARDTQGQTWALERECPCQESRLGAFGACSAELKVIESGMSSNKPIPSQCSQSLAVVLSE